MKIIKIVINSIIPSIAFYYLITFDFKFDSLIILDFLPTIYIILNLYTILKNRDLIKKDTLDNFKINTNKDRHNKILLIIQGSIILIGSILGLIYSSISSIFWCLLIINSILIFISKHYQIPNGIIKIEKGFLTILNSKKENSFTINELKEIHIKKEEIKVINNTTTIYSINQLKLSPKEQNRMLLFFNRDLFKGIVIKHMLNHK